MSPTALRLMIFHTGFDTTGEFFRDVAVLVLVFVPIDLWRRQDFQTWHYVELVLSSIGFFVVGLALQCTANFVERTREIYDAEEDIS
jgi:hypothetical protein